MVAWCVYRTLKFKDFHGVVFFAHPEYFEIAENRFLSFGVAVHLDAKEVTLILPV